MNRLRIWIASRLLGTPVHASAPGPASPSGRPVEPRHPSPAAWEQMLERVFGPDPDQWPDHPFRAGDIITITTNSGEVRLATVHNVWFDPSFTPPRAMVTTRNQHGTVQWHWPATSCERVDWVPR